MSSSLTQHQHDDTNFDDLMKALTDNFNILADEVQLLSDRKTILEHKLRFAHEQYQQLADRYAPGNPDIFTTLAALQIPPDLHIQTPERATFVPLPSRRPTGSKQQTAEAIRDGRKASQRIASLRGWLPASESGERSTTGTAHSTMRTSQRGTSATTVLEQDFTVPGKMSKLECPFASKAGTVDGPNDNENAPEISNNNEPVGLTPRKDLSPHCSADPICAAMYSDTHSSHPASATGSAKCPIRFLDHHSPEEVAQYFETHKHEIPRSHEVCVKRYQRNEDDIRKLDAKYGNIVSMIQGLGAKHQPMLHSNEAGLDEIMVSDMDDVSNERVQNWAKAVSSSGIDVGDEAQGEAEEEEQEDRASRFDRSLRDVRVGESPSRPWGIQVPYSEMPIVEPEDYARPVSPPPAPVPMPHHQQETSPHAVPADTAQPSGKCPFGHGASKPKAPSLHKTVGENPEPVVYGSLDDKPTFLQHEGMQKDKSTPQMVFTGPVFIGYPINEAMALMKQWQKGSATS